jgi:MFS family permease
VAVTTAPPPRARLRDKAWPPDRDQRALAAAAAVNAFGSGMFMSSSALYFTRIVGLPMTQVALGLFIGAMAGLAAGIVAGRIADRWGARETQIVVMAAGAVMMSLYLVVTTFTAYVVVSVLLGLVYAADKSSKAPLIRGLGGDDPVGYRAYLRSLVNFAIAGGSLAAGVGMAVDTRAAYLCLIGGRALAFLAAAVIMRRIPHLAPVPSPGVTGKWVALRDRPYLSATALNCLMSLHFAIPTFALPLWIAEHTSAPRWMIAGTLCLNAVMVILLQVQVSKGVDDHRSAGRRMAWAGAAICLGMALMAAAGGRSALLSVVLLTTATIVYTFGELWHAAAAMEYSFGLAAPHAQGQYSGVFGLGAGIAEAIAPLLLGLVVIHGRPAWLLIGAGFLAVGLVSRPLVSRSLRQRQPAAA